jgi:hypothetical protein
MEKSALYTPQNTVREKYAVILKTLHNVKKGSLSYSQKPFG